MIETGWEYTTQLRRERIRWNCWWGRLHAVGAPWLTDGTMAVRRSAIKDKLREDRLDSFPVVKEVEIGKKKLQDGTNVERYLRRMPTHRAFHAEWLGSWTRPHMTDRVVALGNPDLATYDVERVRLAHLLVEFDDALWIPFQDKQLMEPFPLILLRDTETVGIVGNYRTWDLKIPVEIMAAARARWPL